MAKKVRLILDICVIVAYSIVLLVILSAPNVRPPRFLKFPHSDKVMHACQFGILSFLICRSLLRHSAGVGRFLVFIASVSITVSYGGTIELIQEAVPGRVADLRDVAADAAGALLAASICLFLETNRKRSQNALRNIEVSQKEQI